MKGDLPTSPKDQHLSILCQPQLSLNKLNHVVAVTIEGVVASHDHWSARLVEQQNKAKGYKAFKHRLEAQT